MFYDPAYDPLESDFPLGDGTADTSSEVTCPCCGAPNEIALDPGSGNSQLYVEDCQVCCRPWLVHLRYQSDGSAEVWLEPADD
jgi:hypothetical protein